MRRQRYLRSSSAQSLCVFCAYRLLPEFPLLLPSTTQPARRLTTTSVSRQTAAAAAAAPPSTSNAPPHSQWSGFDPNSSLSASEQRERAALRERRALQESQRRDAVEAQRQRGEAAAQAVAEQRRVEREGRERQAREERERREKQARAERDAVVAQEERERRAKSERHAAAEWERRKREGAANTPEAAGSRGHGDRTRQQQQLHTDSRRGEPEGAARDAARSFTIRRLHGAKDGQNQTGGRTMIRLDLGASDDAGRQKQQQGQPQPAVRHAGQQQQPQPRRQRGNPTESPRPPPTQASPKVEKAAMPAFSFAPLPSFSQTDVARKPVTNSGWGSGPVERAPLVYGAKVPAKPNPNITEAVEPGKQESNGREADGWSASRAVRSVISQQDRSPFEGEHTPQRVLGREVERSQTSEAPVSLATSGGPERGLPDEHSNTLGGTPGLNQSQQTSYDNDSGDRHAQVPDFVAALSGRSEQQSHARMSRDPLDLAGPQQQQDDAIRSVPRDQSAWPTSPARIESQAPLHYKDRHGVLRQQSQSDGQEGSKINYHGSGAPPSSAAQYDHKSYNGNGSHTLTFKPQEDRQSQSELEEDQTVNWKHLRRRHSEPTPPPPPPPQQQRRSQVFDDDWVDRKFQDHLQQRAPQPVSSFSLPPAGGSFRYKPQFAPEPARNTAIRRCGRCGEEGHVARDCTGPIRAKCTLCLQSGHYAKDCPTRSTGARTPSQTPMFADAREEGSASASILRDHARQAYGDKADEVGGRQKQMSDRGERAEKQAEDKEEPAERTLRSRKFADEAPRREKAARGGRRRDEDDEEDDDAGAAREERNQRKPERKAEREKAQAAMEARAAERKARTAEARHQISLPEFVSVATLAQVLGVRYDSFVSRLERLGYDDIFPGKVFNAETSGMIAMEYDYDPIFESGSTHEAEERDLKPAPVPEDTTYLPARPPVVTIMGHVDHGKTTILDYLRKSAVAAGEAGGITQHIGAFSVPLATTGKTITFLDTPGHAAFLAMRERGATVTDILVLVVAADDSVKPQTLEAMKHASTAGVPMIVAVNKIDKEGADLQRVKQDLARHGVEIEDFGGEVQVIPVSGKTGEGMEDLEEAVVTLSEILDHRADTNGEVEGWVLEATTKKAGRVATVLVRRGTLRPGTILVAGSTWTRVRTLHDEDGEAVMEVGPGMPVEVDGWRDQPAAGDEVLQAPTEQKATDVVDYRIEQTERERTAADIQAINISRRLEQEKREKEKALAAAAKRQAGLAVDDEAAAAAAKPVVDALTPAANPEEPSGQQMVPLIIKADVSGSAEAVSAYILSLSSPLIAPQILRSHVGRINESDVDLAATAHGHIVAFNLPPDEGVKGLAESRGVRVLENNIIYRVLDDVRAVLEERLPPIVTQRVLGEAEVSVSFAIGVGGRKKMIIAGCKVRNGVVGKGARVRVLRAGVKVYDGTIGSLKNVKKEVQEMRKGTECGMGFAGWEAFEIGDVVQTYEEIREKRRL